MSWKNIRLVFFREVRDQLRDRRTLFICTASDGAPETCQSLRDGRIEVVEVEVPGAGLP